MKRVFLRGFDFGHRNEDEARAAGGGFGGFYCVTHTPTIARLFHEIRPVSAPYMLGNVVFMRVWPAFVPEPADVWHRKKCSQTLTWRGEDSASKAGDICWKILTFA